MNARRLSFARPWRSGAIGLLALALLVAQALGVVHRIEHGPAGAELQAAWDVVRTAADGHADAHADRSQGVQGDHDDDGVHDCAAFDHATVADAAPLPAPPPVEAVAPRVDGAPVSAAPPLAAEAAGYLARGPPAA